MQWTTAAAMVSARQTELHTDGERLRAGRAARRRRIRARRGGAETQLTPELTARRNGHAPAALAPSTTC